MRTRIVYCARARRRAIRVLHFFENSAPAGRDRSLAEQLASHGRDRRDRVRTLVSVRAKHDHDPRPPLDASRADVWWTRLARGGATHLSSHARHPRPATSDKTKGSQAQPGRQPQTESARRPVGNISSASDVTDEPNQNSKPQGDSATEVAPRHRGACSGCRCSSGSHLTAGCNRRAAAATDGAGLSCGASGQAVTSYRVIRRAPIRSGSTIQMTSEVPACAHWVALMTYSVIWPRARA